MKETLLLVLIGCSGAWAQTRSNDFPDGAAAMTQDALRASMEDKVFAVKAATGPEWRWQFKSNGFFFINIGSFSDSGRWSAKDSTI